MLADVELDTVADIPSLAAEVIVPVEIEVVAIPAEDVVEIEVEVESENAFNFSSPAVIRTGINGGGPHNPLFGLMYV